MRKRKQNGTIIRIGDRWYVRYWERRNSGGSVERKRVTHALGQITTRGKHPPANIVKAAEDYMQTVNNSVISAEHTITFSDFVENIFLPHVKENLRARPFRPISFSHRCTVKVRMSLRKA